VSTKGPLPERITVDTNAISRPFLKDIAGRVQVVFPAVVVAEHARQGYCSSLEHRKLKPEACPYDETAVKAYVQQLVENFALGKWIPDREDWGCLAPFGLKALHSFGRHFGERFGSKDWSTRKGRIDALVAATAEELGIPLVSDDNFFEYLDKEFLPSGQQRRYKTQELIALFASSGGASPPATSLNK
jgi:predicted nucleic acid-binding protein